MYTAIIIEPRIHSALKIVLPNFDNNLDNNWDFLIFHGNNNKKYIEDIFHKNKSKRKIHYISLHVDNLSVNEYNKMLLSHYFYENIKTEHFLIFQLDALISEKYKDNIYNFLEYDYVGAPWAFNRKIGNGGLSLRKKSKMLEILNKESIIKPNGEYFNEDFFFSCHSLKNTIVKKPTFNLGKEFSVESVYSSNSFGIHKPWIFLNKEELELLCNDFPMLKELMKVLSHEKEEKKKEEKEELKIRLNISDVRLEILNNLKKEIIKIEELKIKEKITQLQKDRQPKIQDIAKVEHKKITERIQEFRKEIKLEKEQKELKLKENNKKIQEFKSKNKFKMILNKNNFITFDKFIRNVIT